jgi:hypothetical protein
MENIFIITPHRLISIMTWNERVNTNDADNSLDSLDPDYDYAQVTF